jgi:hypothetical protein
LEEKERLIEELKAENNSILSSSRSRVALQELEFNHR